MLRIALEAKVTRYIAEHHELRDEERWDEERWPDGAGRDGPGGAVTMVAETLQPRQLVAPCIGESYSTGLPLRSRSAVTPVVPSAQGVTRPTWTPRAWRARPPGRAASGDESWALGRRPRAARTLLAGRSEGVSVSPALHRAWRRVRPAQDGRDQQPG